MPTLERLEYDLAENHVVSLIAALLVGVLVGAALALMYSALRGMRRTRDIRRNAVSQSLAVTRGQVFEQFAAYFPDFEFSPKDAQFLGKPVDFVVFDGLDEGELRRIVFVEIKTGEASLSTRERRIRDAIRRGDVEWRELRLGADGSSSRAQRGICR
jgi:predicted Holliday junction resolvase-like endonuclease